MILAITEEGNLTLKISYIEKWDIIIEKNLTFKKQCKKPGVDELSISQAIYS